MVSEKGIETLVRFAEPLVESGMLSKTDLEGLRNINHPPQKNIEIPVLISMQEAAKMLKVTVKCIYDYVHAGDLELIKIGHRTSRITLQSIETLVQRGRRIHRIN